MIGGDLRSGSGSTTGVKVGRSELSRVTLPSKGCQLIAARGRKHRL